jgi:hypothetical protein
MQAAQAIVGRELTVPSLARQPLIWLNVWCLDAPLVAIAWQWLFARSSNIALPSASREALFLTAWFIYLVDRFADSISLAFNVPKSARQEFCLRHRFLWLLLMSAIVALDGSVIFTRLDSTTLRHGMLLGAIAIGYLGINNVFNTLWETLPLKEIAIGLLFSAGTLLAVAPHISSARPEFALAAFLFAGVCSLNCVSIAVWERDLDLSQQKHSIATHWRRTRLINRSGSLRIVSMVLAAGCVVLAIVDRQSWQLALCMGISAVLLSALDLLAIGRDEQTALADLVLLAPLLLIFVETVL